MGLNDDIDTSEFNSQGSPVTFEIFLDGKLAWKSDKVKKVKETQEFDISTLAVDELVLRTSVDGSNSQACAVWVDPQLKVRARQKEGAVCVGTLCDTLLYLCRNVSRGAVMAGRMRQTALCAQLTTLNVARCACKLFTRAGVSALGYRSLACCLPQPTPLPKADLIGMDTPQGIAQATLAYCGMLANNYMRLMKQVVRLQE